MDTVQQNWASYHLYFHTNTSGFDQLLQAAVRPTVKELSSENRLGSWFFVRYWEGGPHVRLRLQGVDLAALEVEQRIRQKVATCEVEPMTLEPDTYYKSVLEPTTERSSWFEHGEVVVQEYIPETERYGGVLGLEVSERLFRASSELALQILAQVGVQAQRLTVSFDLLGAFLKGMSLSRLDAIHWLRGGVFAWPLYTRLSSQDTAHIRLLAEQEYFKAEDRYRQRLSTARAADHQAPPHLRFWSAKVKETFSQYQRLEVEDQLNMPTLEIMRSQLHMFHNRLGLSIREECYLTWLMSLVLANTTSRVAFAGEDFNATDRVYHEQSKLYPQHESSRPPSAGAPPEKPTLIWHSEGKVDLPVPEELPSVTLGETLKGRRSSYSGYKGSLSLGTLSSLLSSSLGAIDRVEIDHPEGQFTYNVRPYPSGGARYPFRTYVLVYNITGLSSGLYSYDDLNHRLYRLASAPDRDLLLRCSPFLDPDDMALVEAADAPLWLFPVADLSYQREAYGHRAYRFVTMECGHLTENIALAATSLKLPMITIGGFYDDMLNQTLLLDSVNQFALYMIPIGQALGTKNTNLEGG